MRLGLDYGGTKIEGIVLDAGRRRARPRPGADPALRLRRRPPGDPRPARAARGRGRRPHRQRRHRRAGLGRPRHRPSSARATPPGCTAATCAATSPAALDRPVKIANDANCFALSEAVDGAGAGAEVVFGVDPRHRRRRRRRRARPARRGDQRHRRRVGPHAAARAARRRAPGPALLLRRRRPHRGLALRPELRRRLRPAQAMPVEDAPPAPGDRRAGRRPATPTPRRRCAATRTGSGARWR